MPDEHQNSDHIVQLLVRSNLKIASVVSSLLFACRLAISTNEQAEKELDTASKKIDEYLDIMGNLLENLDVRGQSSD